MYRMTVIETFAAAHSLPEHSGACRNVHGHTWKVEVEMSFERLNDLTGMTIDFAEVKHAVRSLLAGYDHQNLNELRAFALVPPTAENIARKIAGTLRDIFAHVTAVTVWESDTAKVRYEMTDQ